MKCADCGGYTCVSYTAYGSIPLCNECLEKREHARLEEKSKSVKKASDFSGWTHNDMSELFWVHLGKYVKNPNEHSLSLMDMAFRWACHANVGLSNSFHNALRWENIDLYKERERWKQ